MAATPGPSAAEDKSSLENNCMTLSTNPLHDDWGSKSSEGTIPNIHQSSDHEKCQIYSHSKTTKSITKHENAGSGENLKSELADQSLVDQRNNEKRNSVATENIIYPTLTEELLEQHDREMERLLRLKYRGKTLKIKNPRQGEDDRKKVAKQQIEPGKSGGKTRGRQCPNSDNRESKFPKISQFNDSTRNPEHVGKNPLNIHETDTDLSQPNMMPQINVRSTLLTDQQYISPRDSNSIAYHQGGLTFYMPTLMIGNHGMNMTTGQFHTLLQIPQQIQPNPYGLYISPLTGMAYLSVINAPMRLPATNIPQMIPRVPMGPRLNLQPTSLLPPVLRQNPETIEHSASQSTSVEGMFRTVTVADSSEKLSLPNRCIPPSVNVDGVDSNPVSFGSVLNIPEKPQLESYSENSSDSSFYGAFLSNSDTSTSNYHSTYSKHLTEKNLEVGECSEEPPKARRGSFAMVNELKAAYELEKANRRSSSG